MAISRTTRRLAWIGIPILLIVLLVAFWQWDWLIPLVESRASAAIGRPVTISHLHVHLGRTIEISADDVVIANPAGWPAGDPPLAKVGRLSVQVDAMAYIRGQGLVLPAIGLDRPSLYAAEAADGTPNFKLATGGGGGGTPPKIGTLKIADGDAHVVVPKLKADFRAKIATQDAGDASKIVVDAQGTYAAQPITGHLVGGALLSLRDQAHPWPIDLTLANGPTHLALNGTLQDPLALKGADLKLRAGGPDMGLLEPLVGIPIPKTPSYQIAGKLDFAGFNRITFQDFRGRLGNSDLGGTIEMRPEAVQATSGNSTADKQGGAYKQDENKSKPLVTLDLQSNRVDLADLGGFIGTEPGRKTTANATPQQRAEVARAESSNKFLPDKPISLPRLNWADIHLRYRSAHIEGRSVPLDDMTVAMDVVGGRITVHPISFGVGKGRLAANVDLTPEAGNTMRAKVDLRAQNLDVSRLMAATHAFKGAGSVSGVGAIDGTGNSLASIVGNGNGEVKLAMAGGTLSALLVDLTGLQFGKALLSALGVPDKTTVECFVGDLGLRRGVLGFDALTLDTDEAIVNVGGNVDLRSEKVDLNLKTDSKHFTVGSLPTRITIGGTFKDPSIRPGAEIAARAGAVAGLAALFAPLAILPTVQFGTSDAEDARCGALLQKARSQSSGKALSLPNASSPNASSPNLGALPDKVPTATR